MHFRPFFTLLALLAFASVSNAQQSALPPIESVAIPGQPFGVFETKVPIPPGASENPRILVSDREGRVFYPVTIVETAKVSEAPARQPRIGRPGGLLDRVRNKIREDRAEEVPVAIRVSGLFQGEGPIRLQLRGDITQDLTLGGTSALGRDHRQQLAKWWADYTGKATQLIQQEDFPKLVHQYLVAMLSRRMQLPNVDLTPEDPEKKDSSQTLKTLALLAAIEPLRDQVLEDVLTLPTSSVANNPLPPEIAWLAMDIPPPIVEPEIETLATRVPPECFYLRFGAFSNFVWFQDIAERYGGDMAQAVLLRGFNYEASARMEKMLAAKMTQLAKMFGDQLVGDLALVGSDLYMKEGASLGVIFYAKNPTLLNTAIRADRRSVVKNTPGARLQDVQIAGRDVQLLSTPDNRVRSFYVQDGDYIFVTSSSALVQRFLEVGAGDRSLADSAHFRWTRSAMPEANNYSVFAYFSPEFFHRLVSPQYQIELRRRLQAIAHLEVAELASQVALAEQQADLSIEQLKAAALLPEWFDQRADGSQTLRDGNRWVDSTRGGRGCFAPIPDVPIAGVTDQELAQYERTANFYLDEWQQMDPMVFGLRRFQANDGTARETIAFEAYIAPFQADKYGWIAKLLGGPTPVELGLPQDDMATLQIHMRGNRTGIGPKSEDFHLFAGVKDMLPPTAEETKGLIKTLRALQNTPAYIGGWPKPGLVEQLPLGIGAALSNQDIYGFSRMIGGLWRWQSDTFSLLSFDRSIIEAAIPQLSVREANDFAQARLKVQPIEGTLLGQWVNNIWYQRGWKASHANTRLLDEVHQQLRIPADECLDVTQRLLDVKLQCPLGGTFECIDASSSGAIAGQTGWWQSTAWSEAVLDANGKPTAPPNYTAPWIGWFRGGRAHLTQGEASLALVGQVDLEMQPLPPQLNTGGAVSLPSLNFDVFSLPMQIFGKDNEAQAPAAPGAPERRKF